MASLFTSESVTEGHPRKLADLRRNKTLNYLRPDGKVQVTIRYGDDGKPAGVDNVVLSPQHHDEVEAEQLRADIAEHVIDPVLPAELRDGSVRTFVNPTGRFVIGGPVADAGLTGRKIMVDTYGGFARHGGGCFSGKDPTKVDRAGAYGARHVAKNIVAAGLAPKCEVQISYAFGIVKTVLIRVDVFGTGRAPDATIAVAVAKLFTYSQTCTSENTHAYVFDSLMLFKHLTAQVRKPLPANHAVQAGTQVLDSVKEAIRSATTAGRLFTLGQKPSFPSIRLGYIHAPGR